ncbi:HTH-type transcriptional repressor YcgE [Vibrio aerogenes CECT 7868]|uniref:HTH-type transcriptional repressor YcgE n=1 Tax=Vibrio aerogenes CECT 7868 TaxID=1216006 RepID=A0A1M6BGX1_9VIBR|nr:MerR family transcriptional regulator [Vibrio aerogenes]SHI47927.1 HTH-type transcriptional repressor YcgE [Vibrio aerogenes CECT 7868]
MDSEEKLYAIREVSEMTGVKPVTLRAWQRRYHLIEPKRTAKGHRLFDEQDIQTIQRIRQWLAKGISIGKVAQLIRHSTEEDSEPLDSSANLNECEALLDALSQLNRGRAEEILSSVFRMYPLSIVEAQFIVPVVNILERMKGSQKSVRKSLFQSLMMTHLSWMVTVENKASSLGKCLCVSFDSAGSIWAWIQTLKQAEKGYFIVMLDGVEDISDLSGHLKEHQFNHVDFFANKSLTVKQQRAIHEFSECFSGEISCSGMLTELHQELGGS